ncbi:MAG: hypothetical protein OXE96_13390 [Gemmatimonadetes bacterium]|nr:hypothetical protein [Gemmatimonadota bacterium]
MSVRTPLPLSGLVLIVMLAGCEDPVDPPDTLTEAEALALFTSLWDGIGFGPDDDVDPGPVDTTVPCPLGGEATVVGTSSADEVGDTLRLEVSAVITPAGCNVSGDGLTFTVDGDPNMRIQMTTDIIGFENIIIGGGVEGKIKWLLGDRSGDCAMDLPLAATVDLSDLENPQPNGGFQGTMCGHDIKLDISLTG